MAKQKSSQKSPVEQNTPPTKRKVGRPPAEPPEASHEGDGLDDLAAVALGTLRTTEEERQLSTEIMFEKFLESLAELPSRGQALQKTGLTRHQIAERLRNDKDFAAKYVEAWELGIDAMEDEAVRRAVLGWQEPVFTRDGYAGEVTKYSDTLLIHLLKGNRRKYRGDDPNQNRGLSEEAKKQLKTVLGRVVEEHLQ